MLKQNFPFKVTYSELAHFEKVLAEEFMHYPAHKVMLSSKVILLVSNEIRIKAARKLIRQFSHTTFTLSRIEATALYCQFGINPMHVSMHGYDIIYRINSTNHKFL